MFFARGNKTIESERIFAHVGVNQQGDFGMQFAESGERGERNLHEIADAADIHEHLIRSLAGRHTVLMSSHILSEVERTADRAGLLLNGRLLGVRAIAETPSLEEWFLSVA